MEAPIMMFDPSEIYRYQTPAIEVCFAMGEQPYEVTQQFSRLLSLSVGEM